MRAIRALAILLGVALAASGLSLAFARDLSPAKDLFGAVDRPSAATSQPIGSYAMGCLAGAVPLPIDGPSWEVMRLSRNRNWGYPTLVAYIERLAQDAAKRDGWNGLLVGDMSMPRGGPMPTGHASHQIGLDADIWLTPMPAHTLTPAERETMSSVSLLVDGKLQVDPAKWSDLDARILKRAASYPEVARIFISPAIKQLVCDTAGTDRTWLRKLRPWTGHDDHFHVRLVCPPGMAGCENQADPPPGDGCGAELASWFKPPPPPPKTPPKPVKPPPPVTLANLPAACTGVLSAPAAKAGG